ncbi:MAG: TIM barrel protein [Planctomycetota bacterium]|nr:TIM barrel protein [Planctomycetota bacterium]MDA1212057.1 TIM barrel protein [Planctomycetota bacterium]
MSQHALSSRIEPVALQGDKRFIRLDKPQISHPPVCRWSLHQISTYRWSLEEDIKRYAAAGIPAIGLWHRKIQEIGEDRTVDAFDESSLGVSSVSWLGGFTGTEGMSHQEAIDESLEAIHLADRLGARSVVVVSGARGRHITSHAHRCIRTALIELGNAAAEVGVTVLLQSESRPLCRPWSIFGNWEQAFDIVASCRHPYVKLAVDLNQLLPVNASRRHLDEIVPFLGQIQLPVTESQLSSDSHISNCRSILSDRNARCADIAEIFTCHVGHASLTSDRVQSLQHAGFSGYVEFEFWSEAVWQSDYSMWLNTLSHNVNAKSVHTNK